MEFNNATLMVLANEREGGPQGVTLLKIKKGEEKLKLLINQELDFYSLVHEKGEKVLNLNAMIGKLLENGDIEWINGFKLQFIIPSNRTKKIMNEYHYLSTTLIEKISLIYRGDGEYILRGQYEIDKAKRTTWDYFKIVEEQLEIR